MLGYLFFQADPWVLPVLLFIVLGLAVELPYRFYKPATIGGRVVKDEVFNALQGGLLTLTAFVLGLSFAQASGRYDDRRGLVVKEANAIGTTWLRAGNLEPHEVASFRRELTDYAAQRLDAYNGTNDPDAVERAVRRSMADQDELWATASSALRAHPTDLGKSLLMQTLNDTIDVSAEQLQALTTHVPTAMLALTLALVAIGALTLGVRFAREGQRPIPMTVALGLAYVIVVTMSVDYDRPHRGLVAISLRPLEIQLQAMKESP